MSEDPPEDVRTPTEEPTADTPPETKLCRFCGEPVTAPRRVRQVKEFCSPRHRAAYHAARRNELIVGVITDLDEVETNLGAVEDELSRICAYTRSLRARLRQATQGKRRAPRRTETT